jgi:DNA-binding NtrC family response regulator
MPDNAILIADDDNDVLTSARYALEKEYKQIITIGQLEKIPLLCKANQIAVLLMDMNFTPGRTTGDEGLQMLKIVKEISPETVVILITAFGDMDLAIKGIKSGAFDFIMKPWKNEKLRASVNSALLYWQSVLKLKKSEERINVIAGDIDKEFMGIIGESIELQKVKEMIKLVAPTDANVLILGENGTGKELVARELHRQSLRYGKPFISVDLGALNETLFESELFGHTKGAFTGATADKPGRFELASGGTIFLDEIGNLSTHLQSKLLTVLEKGTIAPLGAVSEVPIDVRLICATNMPLRVMTEEQTFRRDLFYRINTFEIEVPALRERTEDIPVLVKHFLKIYGKRYRKKIVEPEKKVLDHLQRYHWPGNIRELRNLVERAVVLSLNDTIDPRILFNIHTGSPFPKKEDLNLEENEKSLIIRALEKNRGNVTRAARDLGIDRNALYRRMKKYGL